MNTTEPTGSPVRASTDDWPAVTVKRLDEVRLPTAVTSMQLTPVGTVVMFATAVDTRPSSSPPQPLPSAAPVAMTASFAAHCLIEFICVSRLRLARKCAVGRKVADDRRQPDSRPVATPSRERRTMDSGSGARFGPMAGFTVQALGPLRAVHPAQPPGHWSQGGWRCLVNTSTATSTLSQPRPITVMPGGPPEDLPV